MSNKETQGDHGLPMLGNSHLIICRYGSLLDGIRSIAFLAKGLACFSVCRLSFGSDIHSRIIFRRVVFRLDAQSFALNGGRRQHKGRVRCFRSLSTTLDDLARASFPAHMGRASSWPNALADRELLSWLCLQTRFRQILEGARIVDRLVAKLLQRFSGECRAPA